MQRMLKFGSAKVPKLSKANLVNTEVHLLIQHIHRLLSQEAFDDSVMGYETSALGTKFKRKMTKES